MASSFLSVAGRKTADVRGFLREAASDASSLKYKAEAGKKHHIYVPYRVVDVDGQQVKELVAISGEVHDWIEGDKYRATVCMKGVMRSSEDGTTLLNDGSCRFCDRVADAWDIYRYRIEQEKLTCGKTGQELIKHIENIQGSFADERKVKEARSYLYLLIVKFRLDATNQPQIGADGLPEYDLKVVKWSASRAEKIQQQIENSGVEFPGAELVFEYPNVEDKRQVVGQSTTAPIYPNSRFTHRFPGLVEKINADIAKFTWDGLEKAYPEWSGMTSAEATKVVDSIFEKWDEYKKEVAVNPGARYLEYAGNMGAAVTNPALSGAQAPVAGAIPAPGMAYQAIPGVAPQMPGVVPQVPPQAPSVAPQMPGVAPQMGAQAQVPGEVQTLDQSLDVNQVFSGTSLDKII